MPDHPCQEGLSAACFAAEPTWYRKALAYKVLTLFLPKQLSKRLPRGLGRALIGPGVHVPEDVNLPPGLIVPPGTTWRSDWNPWLNFIYAVFDQWDILIALGLQPGDPLPVGFALPDGTVMPSGGFASLAAAAAWLNNYLSSLAAMGNVQTPPLHVGVFGPGPIGGSRVTQSGAETIIEIVATGGEQTSNTDVSWAVTRDTDTNASGVLETTGTTSGIEASNNDFNRLMQRAIFLFSLAEIPAGKTITAATLTLTLDSGVGVTAIVQTCPSVLWPAAADYLSASGAGSDIITLAAGANIFTLSSASLSELESKIGADSYLMLREQAHDYADVDPSLLDGYLATVLTWRAGTPAERPLLTLTYR